MEETRGIIMRMEETRNYLMLSMSCVKKLLRGYEEVKKWVINASFEWDAIPQDSIEKVVVPKQLN